MLDIKTYFSTERRDAVRTSPRPMSKSDGLDPTCRSGDRTTIESGPSSWGKSCNCQIIDLDTRDIYLSYMHHGTIKKGCGCLMLRGLLLLHAGFVDALGVRPSRESAAQLARRQPAAFVWKEAAGDDRTRRTPDKTLVRQRTQMQLSF
jgi:hypothetical protein